MSRTKIGIIGCGNISDIYLKNCTKTFGNLEVAAVSDLVPERARRAAEAYGIKKVLKAEELVSDPEIDIVLNLTTPHVHSMINLVAIDAGKHVYTEGPGGDPGGRAETASGSQGKGLAGRLRAGHLPGCRTPDLPQADR